MTNKSGNRQDFNNNFDNHSPAKNYSIEQNMVNFDANAVNMDDVQSVRLC